MLDLPAACLFKCDGCGTERRFLVRLACALLCAGCWRLKGSPFPKFATPAELREAEGRIPQKPHREPMAVED